jgi:uncharacterized protein YggE
MSSYGRMETHPEGVSVIGEAVRAILPERAEILIEITAGAQTAAQALRDNQVKTAQVMQAIASLNVQAADVEAISLKVHSLYSPLVQSLAPYGGVFPQTGQGPTFPYTPPVATQEVQFGSYQARNMLRITVRDPARAGDVADAVARAGGTVGPLSFRVTDEANTRRAVLEAAGRDAKAKAEALANVAGKQAGDLLAIREEAIVSNGTYTALRTAMPWAFGAGAPEVVGELQYYARVSAIFRLQ